VTLGNKSDYDGSLRQCGAERRVVVSSFRGRIVRQGRPLTRKSLGRFRFLRSGQRMQGGRQNVKPFATWPCQRSCSGVVPKGVLVSAHLGDGFSTATTETWRASPLANVIPLTAQNGAPPRLANISRPEIVFEAEWRRDRVVRTYASRVPSEMNNPRMRSLPSS
jgi:hypothetical protein